jgi:hypothetical protein
MVPLKEMEPLLERLMQFDALANDPCGGERKSPSLPIGQGCRVNKRG